MKEIKEHIKDIIIIIILWVISLLLGALFLKIEDLKKQIQNQVHALVENTIRDTMKSEFEYDRQNYKFILETND